MKGRALTAEQKKEIINRVYVAWLSMPELRLGQLIANATRPDAFYLEDEDFAQTVESYVTKSLVKG